MTTTVQNVFADTLVTATAANGPTLETDNNSTSSTSTASQSYSSNWPGYDPDGPTNTYDSTKYVYQVQFNYTSINFTLTVNSIDSYDVDGPRTLSSSNLGTDFYYRGSGTQSGATNTLPASVSTTQTFTGGTTATNGQFSRNYSVSRTFNVNASWHWEGNLFSIDGVGGDTFEDISVQSTLTCSAGFIRGGISSPSVDAELTCQAGVTRPASADISSQLVPTITSAVTHGFDLSSVDVFYVSNGDSTQGDYVLDGDSSEGGYVTFIVLPDLTNSYQTDFQFSVVGGIAQYGESSISSDIQTSISGAIRPSIQGQASISSDIQVNVSGANLVSSSTTISSDVSTSGTAGNLLTIGGQNYHNFFVEEGYVTPEEFTGYDVNSQLQASAFRLYNGEGILESASQINVTGGYLIASGSLLYSADCQFTIDQTTGTSAGIIHGGFTIPSDADFVQTTSANLTIDIDDNLIVQSQLATTPGYLLSGDTDVASDTQLAMEGTIIPGASLLARIDSQLTALGGYLKDLEAAIQSDGFALTVAQYKIVDPFRTIRVKSENRQIIVPNEQRLYIIDTENRVNKVGQEIRSYIVPQETRQIKAQHLILDRGIPVGSNERRIG